MWFRTRVRERGCYALRLMNPRTNAMQESREALIQMAISILKIQKANQKKYKQYYAGASVTKKSWFRVSCTLGVNAQIYWRTVQCLADR